MYRLTDDVWTGSPSGSISVGRTGRNMDVEVNSMRPEGSTKCAVETPFLYRRRRRQRRRAH